VRQPTCVTTALLSLRHSVLSPHPVCSHLTQCAPPLFTDQSPVHPAPILIPLSSYPQGFVITNAFYGSLISPLCSSFGLLVKPPLTDRFHNSDGLSGENSPRLEHANGAVRDKRKREVEGVMGSVTSDDANNLSTKDDNKGKRSKVDNDESRAASAFFENPWLLRSMVLAERLDDSKPEVVNAQEAVVFSHAFGLEEVFATCQMAVTVSEHSVAEGEGEGEGEENDALDADGDHDQGDATPGDRDRDREGDNLTEPPEDFLRLQARLELKAPLSFMAAFVQMRASEWDQSSVITKSLGRVHRGKYCHNMNRLLFDFTITPKEVPGPAIAGSGMAAAGAATVAVSSLGVCESSSSRHGDKSDSPAEGADQDPNDQVSESYYDPKEDFRDIGQESSCSSSSSSSSSSSNAHGTSSTSQDAPSEDTSSQNRDGDRPPISTDTTQSTSVADADVPDTEAPTEVPDHSTVSVPLYSEGERWLLSAVKSAGPGGLTLDSVGAILARRIARGRKNSVVSASGSSSSSSSLQDISSMTSDDFIQMGKKLASRNDIILDLGYGFHDTGLHCIETVEKNPVHFVHSSFSNLYYVPTGPDLFPGEGACPWVSVGGTRNELFYRMLRSKVAGILSIRPGSSLRSLHAGFPQLSLSHLSVLVSTMAQEGLLVARAPPVCTLLSGPFAKRSVCVPAIGYYLRL
jgi:transposase